MSFICKSHPAMEKPRCSYALVYLALLFCVGPSGCYRTHTDSATKQDIRTLKSSVLNYQAEYGRYPVVNKLASEQPSSDVISLLCGDENARTNLNPRTNKSFLSVPSNRRDAKGSFLDTFGDPYHFAFDIDGSRMCRIGTNVIHASFVIWSDGLNRRNDNCTGDDVWITDSTE